MIVGARHEPNNRWFFERRPPGAASHVGYMLDYPKIPPSRNCPDGRCVAFEKLDGTNLHFDCPRQFVRDFGHLPIPRVVYEGKLTGRFADDVRRGKYDVAEDVVCKGGDGGDDLWMAKIKTDAYMERLKRAFAVRWEEYWE